VQAAMNPCRGKSYPVALHAGSDASAKWGGILMHNITLKRMK
jgi:hypothetical protein